jgi:hypothetical protein
MWSARRAGIGVLAVHQNFVAQAMLVASSTDH